MTVDHAQFESEALGYFDALSDISFEKSNCIFCGQKGLFHLLFKKGTMLVGRCQCGFVYNQRQPSSMALSAFYEHSEAMDSWSKLKTTKSELIRQQDKFEEAATFLVKEGVRKVLDVGCGTGAFLSRVKSLDRDVDVRGVDTHPGSIEVARQNGIPVVNLTVDQFLDVDTAIYDAISLWGVLEHVKNPLRILKALRSRLAPKGHLVACVPNVASAVVSRHWAECFTFCPQHLWYFDLQSLERLFLAAGFQFDFYYTIESEALPYLKGHLGLSPYGEVPDWVSKAHLGEEKVTRLDQEIIEAGLGYKIVAFGSQRTIERAAA